MRLCTNAQNVRRRAHKTPYVAVRARTRVTAHGRKRTSCARTLFRAFFVFFFFFSPLVDATCYGCVSVSVCLCMGSQYQSALLQDEDRKLERALQRKQANDERRARLQDELLARELARDVQQLERIIQLRQLVDAELASERIARESSGRRRERRHSSSHHRSRRRRRHRKESRSGSSTHSSGSSRRSRRHSRSRSRSRERRS